MRVNVSVLMPVFNGEKWIAEAIDSVLNQSYTDFELLILNDGSTDSTEQVILSYKDKRIKYVKRNHDFISALNDGLRMAQGKYIARMDADDVMHPDRLKIQVSLMERNPEIDFCNSWFTLLTNEEHTHMVVRKHSGLVLRPSLVLLCENIFCHSAMMMKRSFLVRHALEYEKDFIYAEDYRMWTRAAEYGAVFYVEPQSLLFYRYSSEQVSRTKASQQRISGQKVKEELVNWMVGQVHEKELAERFYTLLKEMKSKNMLREELLYRYVYMLFKQNLS